MQDYRSMNNLIETRECGKIKQVEGLELSTMMKKRMMIMILFISK